MQARHQGWAYAAFCFLGSHLGALAARLCHGLVTGSSFCLSPIGTELANWGFYLCKRQCGFQLFSAPPRKSRSSYFSQQHEAPGSLWHHTHLQGECSCSLQTQGTGEGRDVVPVFNSLKNGSLALSYPDIRAWGSDMLWNTAGTCFGPDSRVTVTARTIGFLKLSQIADPPVDLIFLI